VRLGTLLGLVACNLVWAAHPTMGKLVLADFPPVYAAWLRYSSALAAYMIAVAALRRARPALRPALARPFAAPAGTGLALVALMGFLTFCFSPLLQLSGLEASQATDNALIIAIEPLMTVMCAWVFVGEAISLAHAAAFAVALGGFALLTGVSGGGFSGGFDPHMAGNLVMLISLVGEASYSTIGRKLLGRGLPAMGIFGTSLFAGAAFLSLATLGYALTTRTPFGHFTAASVLGILWLGPLGTSATYLFWALALREATIASLSLTLFIQPVFGSILGHFLLGDHLSGVQAAGGALILAAVAAQTVVTFGVK
jgi:drug/metabolite transporter (DMT)-like permease